MRIDPFVSVDGTSFAVSPEELVRAFGVPLRQARNAVELEEFDYGDTVFRFQRSGRLEEVTTRVEVLHLGPLAIPFGAIEPFIRSHDPSMFERGGFIVSPRFGLAFAPTGGRWVTALAAHCLDEWRSL
ncbi:hypothetical protein [Ideonella sp. YS5]|uniref:hypothetical protein n=1 Tax=Ideonella sp. YS5 TaxID=3453714 RepID=UPI003EEB28F8